MNVATYEGTVEDGRIKLSEGVRLPEQARVYVVVPEGDAMRPIHLRSPRLARPAQAVDFVKEVTEATDDAGL